jgi:hypothetical protein
MEKGEQAAKLLGERPQRPPKEWPMRLSVPGDSRTLLWHGFKCGSAVVNPVALGDGPAVWRTCIVATAAWEGDLPLKARSILRPGDTFNRILGKRLALSRLVKLLIPGKGTAEKKKRGKLFLALAPTPRAPRFAPVNGKSGFIASKLGFVSLNHPGLDSLSMDDWDKGSQDFYRRLNGLKLPTEQDLRDTLSRINKEQKGGTK